jgi:hypothetical protein
MDLPPQIPQEITSWVYTIQAKINHLYAFPYAQVIHRIYDIEDGEKLAAEARQRADDWDDGMKKYPTRTVTQMYTKACLMNYGMYLRYNIRLLEEVCASCKLTT